MGNITFASRLIDSDWDETLAAWRCPALQIPGAVVRDIIVDGKRIDKAEYEVLHGQAMIHWVLPDRPERIAVVLELTESLSLVSETERWKRLAIVLPVAATIIAASISAAATYFGKAENRQISLDRQQTTTDPRPPPNASATNIPSPPGTSRDSSPDIGSGTVKFNISMPRGDKVCLSWPGKPDKEDSFDLLRAAGISVVDFNQGISVAYGALAQKSPYAIHYIPGFIEKILETIRL
jgi:hypothetical protein